MSARMYRRSFLQASAAMAATSFTGAMTHAETPDRDRVRVAIIGVAGRGAANLQAVANSRVRIFVHMA